MKLIKGNMWDFVYDYDIMLLTTNGFVKHNGENVMGRGNALQANKKWPMLARHLGSKIKVNGNIVQPLIEIGDTTILAAFPVKDFWYNDARLDIIGKSCGELLDYMDKNNLTKALLPMPGVGNGKLSFESVLEYIRPLLDDRVDLIIYSTITEENEM